MAIFTVKNLNQSKTTTPQGTPLQSYVSNLVINALSGEKIYKVVMNNQYGVTTIVEHPDSRIVKNQTQLLYPINHSVDMLNVEVFTTQPPPPPVVKNITFGVLTDCTSNLAEGTYNLDGSESVVLTCSSGYEFTQPVTYESEWGVSEEINLNWGEYNSDKTICTIPITKPMFKISAIGFKKSKETLLFTNVFTVDSSNLLELSNKRYRTLVDSGEVLDYGKYIFNLYQIPFNIEGIKSDVSKNIILGGFDTEIATPFLDDYTLNVDLGDIIVNEKYSNAYDYNNTECVLYTPYHYPISLDVSKVIGSVLNIKYEIDLYNRQCTIVVSSNFSDSIIYIDVFEIGVQIPFIQQQTKNISGDINTQPFNNIDNAYIEVIRNVPYGDSGMFGKDVVEYGVIGNYTDYIEVSDVVLKSSCTNSEKDEINNLLKSGVIID